jgi:hypothetical protein
LLISNTLTRDFIRLLQRCIAPDFLSIHICLLPSVRPVDSTGHGSRCIPYLDPPRDLPWHYVRSDSEISSAYGCDSRGCSRLLRHFRTNNYLIPLIMANRRNPSSAQKKPSRQRNQGTLRSLVYSAAIRSDTSQGLETLRKRNHDKSEEANDLNRNTHLSQQKRHVHITSGILSEANLTCRVTESHTDRAISKTSSIFIRTPFSRANN